METASPTSLILAAVEYSYSIIFFGTEEFKSPTAQTLANTPPIGRRSLPNTCQAGAERLWTPQFCEFTSRASPRLPTLKTRTPPRRIRKTRRRKSRRSRLGPGQGKHHRTLSDRHHLRNVSENNIRNLHKILMQSLEAGSAHVLSRGRPARSLQSETTAKRFRP